MFGELFNEKRAVIQEDQVVALAGKVQNDEFSGGLRVTAEKLMDLAEVRAAYAKVLRLSINGQADAAKLRRCSRRTRAARARVAIRYRNAQGECDIRLPGRLSRADLRAAARLAERVATRRTSRSSTRRSAASRRPSGRLRPGATSTFRTRAASGPRRAQRIIASTASVTASTAASTVPSRRLRTQPANARGARPPGASTRGTTRPGRARGS